MVSVSSDVTTTIANTTQIITNKYNEPSNLKHIYGSNINDMTWMTNNNNNPLIDVSFIITPPLVIQSLFRV